MWYNAPTVGHPHCALECHDTLSLFVSVAYYTERCNFVEMSDSFYLFISLYIWVDYIIYWLLSNIKIDVITNNVVHEGGGMPPLFFTG